MSQPRRFRSHDSAVEEGPGRVEKTRAHGQFGMFVQVEDFDPEADEFEMTLEVSPNKEVWAPVANPAPADDDIFNVTADDLVDSGLLTSDDNDDGVFGFYTSHHNVPIEYVRSSIITHTGGFEVTVDLYLSGWTQRGASFEHAVFDS